MNEQASPANPPVETTPASAGNQALSYATDAAAPPDRNHPAPNELEAQSNTGAVRFAPRYLAISQAVLVAWLYLAFGEFVLAGLPEGLGWFFLIAIGGLDYFIAESRIAPYYFPERSTQQRVTILAWTAVVCGALLFSAMLLGALFPEPVVTVLLFVVLAFLAFSNHLKRTKLLSLLPTQSSWIVSARVMLVGGISLFAVVKALGRIS